MTLIENKIMRNGRAPIAGSTRMLGRPRVGNLKDERYGPNGIYFYEWANDRLRLVKVIKVGSYPTTR